MKLKSLLLLLLFTLLLSNAALAYTQEVRLYEQANLGADGICGNDAGEPDTACNSETFRSFGIHGSCYSDAASSFGIGGCSIRSPHSVLGETIYTSEFTVSSNLISPELVVATTNFGGGTFSNERADLYLNGRYIGRTNDAACNLGYDCSSEGDCMQCHDDTVHYDRFQLTNLLESDVNHITFVSVGGSFTVIGYGITGTEQECIPGEINGELCGSSIGVCEQGVRTRVCEEPGYWGDFGECVGEVGPSTEVCNELDDDCDGETDESLICGIELELNVPDFHLEQDSGYHLHFVNLFDWTVSEALRSDLSYAIEAESNPEIVDCALVNGNFINCFTQPGKFGISTLTVSVNDEVSTEIDTFDIIVDPLPTECLAGDIESELCGRSTGVCEQGIRTRVCEEPGYWGDFGECAGEVSPSTEVCNELDDDCDGEIDELLYCYAAPQLSVPDQTVEEDSIDNPLLDLWDYTIDGTVSLIGLVYTIISQSDIEVINCGIRGDHFVHCIGLEGPGVSAITVAVEDGSSVVKDTFDITVKPVNDAPTGTIDVAQACLDGLKQYSIDVLDKDSKIVKALWDFGDGSDFVEGFKPTHVYHKIGEYTIKVTVKDAEGAVLILTDKILVSRCDKHELSIKSAFIENDLVLPGDTINVYVKVKNTGTRIESVLLTGVILEEGVIERLQSVRLDQKDEAWKVISLKVPADIKRGVYTIKVSAVSGDASVQKYLSFEVF
ncbi:MAG: PKD domain-containing protein [Nanoarchaeota archaeon]